MPEYYNLPAWLIKRLSRRVIKRRFQFEEFAAYYGFPKCCGTYTTYHRFRSCNVYHKRRVAVAKGTGFLPCLDCVRLIEKGKTTLESLIKNRICPYPFPLDEDTEHPQGEDAFKYIE